MPSHHLNRCWNVVNLTLANKLQWNKSQSKFVHFHSRKFIWKYHLGNGGDLVSASMCLKQLLGKNGYCVSIVAADALVLKHQGISSHNTGVGSQKVYLRKWIIPIASSARQCQVGVHLQRQTLWWSRVFHRSFSNLVRTFICSRPQTSFVVEATSNYMRT